MIFGVLNPEKIWNR